MRAISAMMCSAVISSSAILPSAGRTWMRSTVSSVPQLRL
jgi:hypothetical protein